MTKKDILNIGLLLEFNSLINDPDHNDDPDTVQHTLNLFANLFLGERVPFAFMDSNKEIVPANVTLHLNRLKLVTAAYLRGKLSLLFPKEYTTEQMKKIWDKLVDHLRNGGV